MKCSHLWPAGSAWIWIACHTWGSSAAFIALSPITYLPTCVTSNQPTSVSTRLPVSLSLSPNCLYLLLLGKVNFKREMLGEVSFPTDYATADKSTGVMIIKLTRPKLFFFLRLLVMIKDEQSKSESCKQSNSCPAQHLNPRRSGFRCLGVCVGRFTSFGLTLTTNTANKQSHKTTKTCLKKTIVFIHKDLNFI